MKKERTYENIKKEIIIKNKSKPIYFKTEKQLERFIENISKKMIKGYLGFLKNVIDFEFNKKIDPWNSFADWELRVNLMYSCFDFLEREKFNFFGENGKEYDKEGVWRWKRIIKFQKKKEIYDKEVKTGKIYGGKG